MIDNEIPVLRKEDLITILEALFKLSQEPNNAFERKDDGLYVLDFYQAFVDHTKNRNVHATSEEMAILHNFTLVNDVLNYKNSPVIVRASDEEGNAIQVKPDGLYIPDLAPTLENHLNDCDIHITDTERRSWSQSLELAKKYTDDLIDALIIYDYEFVNNLPEDESLIKNETVYCLFEELPEGDKYFVRYLYREHKWINLDLTKEAYKLFARKKYLDDNFVNKTDNTVHKHDNKDVLDKFTENQENQRLLYNGLDILDTMQISDDADNALFRGSDEKLYVKDLSSELKSISTQASLSKVILLHQECDEAGIYELEEDINNFNFIMIHYYLKPDDPNLDPYDAKMEMLDTDGLNELYEKHVDYIIEHDYGISTYNTKIRFFDGNKMQITYYNHVCIYKIIGVR